MNKMLRQPLWGIFILSNLLLASCNDNINKIEFEKNNPTEYVFNQPMDTVYYTIVKQLQYDGLIMTWDDIKMLRPDISNLFPPETNKSDVLLWSVAPNCKSKIYFANDKVFFDYSVSFYLHLETINESQSKISIKTIEPKIIAGKEIFPSLPHFVRKPKTITVERSTIEEYQILLDIGKLLGEKVMPCLILPNRDCKTIIVNRQ